MRRTMIATLFLVVLATTACSSLGLLARIALTNAKLSDLTIEGVKTEECVALQPEAQEIAPSEMSASLATLGTVGCVMPITRVGDQRPFFVYCVFGDFQKRCEDIPLNATVVFTGKPIGNFLIPSRLTVR